MKERRLPLTRKVYEGLQHMASLWAAGTPADAGCEGNEKQIAEWEAAARWIRSLHEPASRSYDSGRVAGSGTGGSLD